jgi:hypothetical protein
MPNGTPNRPIAPYDFRVSPLATAGWGRFDPFAKPSINDRYLAQTRRPYPSGVDVDRHSSAPSVGVRLGTRTPPVILDFVSNRTSRLSDGPAEAVLVRRQQMNYGPI